MLKYNEKKTKVIHTMRGAGGVIAYVEYIDLTGKSRKTKILGLQNFLRCYWVSRQTITL